MVSVLASPLAEKGAIACGVVAPPLPDEAEVVLYGKVLRRDVCQRAVCELRLHRDSVHEAHPRAGGDASLDRGYAGELNDTGEVADGQLACRKVTLEDFSGTRSGLAEHEPSGEKIRDARGALPVGGNRHEGLSRKHLALEDFPVERALHEGEVDPPGLDELHELGRVPRSQVDVVVRVTSQVLGKQTWGNVVGDGSREAEAQGMQLVLLASKGDELLAQTGLVVLRHV